MRPIQESERAVRDRAGHARADHVELALFDAPVLDFALATGCERGVVLHVWICGCMHICMQAYMYVRMNICMHESIRPAECKNDRVRPRTCLMRVEQIFEKFSCPRALSF